MPPEKRPLDGQATEAAKHRRIEASSKPLEHLFQAPVKKSPQASYDEPPVTNAKKRLRNDSYTVGWIAALSLELAAAISMLDHEHESPEGFIQGTKDSNVYVWGEIAGHNIVIACLNAGEYGLVSAATTASNLLSAFPSIKFGLMVGIGAGVPQPRNKPDIRLGDVVISQPEGQTGGVYQYDLRKAKSGGDFEAKGFLNGPPSFLLKSLTLVQARHKGKRPDLQQHLSRISDDMAEPEDGEPGFVHQGVENDRLFRQDYRHCAEDSCDKCDPAQQIKRTPRKTLAPRFHYGIIASGNTLIKDSLERDDIAKRVPGRCLCLEMEAAGLMNNFPCLVVRGICDYADSHKNDQWQPYAAATAAAYSRELLQFVPKHDVENAEKATDLMQEIAQDMKKATKALKSTDERLKRTEVIEWLKPADPWPNLHRAMSKRQSDTGQWFLDSSEFKSWKEEPHSFLWLYGRPGCGKTVLSSTIIDHLRSDTLSSDSAILFYYFDFNDAAKRSPEGLLRSLLFQIDDRNDEPLAKICELRKSLQESPGSSLPSNDDLTALITSCLNSFKSVAIVLDALDEVDKKERSQLFGYLKSISQTPETDVNFLIISRKEYDIDEAMSGLSTISLTFPKDAISEDIRTYIRARVRDFETYPKLKRWESRPEIQCEIEETISSKADGMFRWAACQLDSIEDCIDLPSLRENLRSLPLTLDDTYSRIIDLIPRNQQANAIKLLQILAFAKRPLRLPEVVDAYAVDPSISPAFTTENRMPNPLEISLICSSLITVVSEKDGYLQFQYVQLAHFTVKEYLLSERLQPKHLQRHFLDLHAHSFMARICLEYMMSVLGDSFPDPVGIERRFPFLKYARTFWVKHAKPGQPKAGTVETIQRFFVHPSAYRYWIIQDVFIGIGSPLGLFSSEFPFSAQASCPDPVLVSIFLGLHLCSSALIDRLNYRRRPVGSIAEYSYWQLRGAYFNKFAYETGSQFLYVTPLYMAASCNDEKSAKKLIARGERVDEAGGTYGTPLEATIWAEIHGTGEKFTRRKIMRHLLDTFAKIEIGTSHLDVAIMCACISEDWSRVRFFLQKGVSLQIGPRTVIALSRFPECRLLEFNKIIVELEMDDALSSAITRGDSLTRESFRSLDPGFGNTQFFALVLGIPGYDSLSCDTGDLPTRLDRNNVVYANDTSSTGRGIITVLNSLCKCNLLHLHSFEGHFEIVELLLYRGADVHEKDENDATALHGAVRGNNSDIAKLLLYYGSKPDEQDIYKQTALHGSARKANLEMAKCILQCGASTEIADIFGMTPLHFAAQKDSCEAVKLLVQYGSRLDAQNYQGQTALHYATSLAMTELLLQHGSSVEIRSKTGQTPLHYAARKGSLEVVKLLVQNGADINTQDFDGLTPLDWAMESVFDCAGTIEWLISEHLECPANP